MSWLPLIGLTVLAVQPVWSAANSDPDGGNLALSLPPVLRSLEPTDSTHLVLPGPPPKPIRHFHTIAPVAKMSKLPAKLVEDPILRVPLPRIAVNPPPSPSTLAIPPDLEREIALFCQKQIGHWKESDARAYLAPLRQRPATDEHSVTNGTIYGFADPTGRYKDLELDFDGESGKLRTVFVYPLAGCGKSKLKIGSQNISS